PQGFVLRRPMPPPPRHTWSKLTEPGWGGQDFGWPRLREPGWSGHPVGWQTGSLARQALKGRNRTSAQLPQSRLNRGARFAPRLRNAVRGWKVSLAPPAPPPPPPAHAAAPPRRRQAGGRARR